MCGGVFLSPDLPGHLLFKTFGVAKPLLNIGMSGPQCQELYTSLKYQRITVTTLKFCIILHIHHLYRREITFCRIHREVETLSAPHIRRANFSRKVLFRFRCPGFAFMHFIIIKNTGIIISFCSNIRSYLCHLALMPTIRTLHVNPQL